MNKNKKAQNVMEYLLIASMVALAGYYFTAKFDMTKLKNYVFNRPASTETINGVSGTRIKIESMTQ